MIRDPSDGSVRENPDTAAQQAFARSQAELNLQGNLTGSVVKESLTTPDTGLRQPTRTDAQERLERSREWLKSYYAREDGEQSDDLVRRGNKSELPSEG